MARPSPIGLVVPVRGALVRVVEFAWSHYAFLVEEVAEDGQTHLRRWWAPGGEVP